MNTRPETKALLVEESEAWLHATRHLDRSAMLEFAAYRFARCMLGEEGREGVSAFIEKRRPARNKPTRRDRLEEGGL